MAPILRLQEIQGRAGRREEERQKERERGEAARVKERCRRKEERERETEQERSATRGGSGEQSKRTGRLFMATILQIYELVPVESSGRRVSLPS